MSNEQQLAERHRLRERVAGLYSPKEDEIQWVLTNWVTDIDRASFTHLKKTGKVKKELKELAREQRAAKNPLSQVLLTCEYIGEKFLQPTEDQYFDAVKEEDTFAIVFWDDLSYGIKIPIGGIHIAERRRIDQTPLDNLDWTAIRLSESFIGKISYKQAATFRLRLSEEEVYLQRLLREDPSGFSIVDHYVDVVFEESLTNADSSLPRVAKYIRAGTGLARKIYKEVYPFTEGLC